MKYLLIAPLFFACTVPASPKVVLPHKTLADKDACPGFQRVNCAPDDDPRQLRFNLVPPVLEIQDDRPAYHEFLGRAFAQPFTRGAIGRYCSSGAENPFKAENVEAKSASSSFEYRFKLKSDFSASADADLVSAAVAAGLPREAKEKLTSAAKAAYSKAKNKEVVTTGRATLVRLPSALISELRFGNKPEWNECRNFLRANKDYAIVKAMMVFHILGSTSNTDLDEKLAADLKISLKGTSAENIASVQTAIDQTVQAQLKSALADRYIVWAVTWLQNDDV